MGQINFEIFNSDLLPELNSPLSIAPFSSFRPASNLLSLSGLFNKNDGLLKYVTPPMRPKQTQIGQPKADLY